MREYIVTCDEETAEWIGNEVDSMYPIVRCRPYQSIDYEKLRKALDFMRIWIADDAHLGESAISRELEKAEGLRRLAEIENAIYEWLHAERLDCLYFPICNFTESYANPDIFYTLGEKKEDE